MRSPARSAGTTILGADRATASVAGGMATTVSRSAPVLAGRGVGAGRGAGIDRADPASTRSALRRRLAATRVGTSTP